MSLGRVVVELDVDSGKFTYRMMEAGKVVSSFSKDIESTATSVRRMEKSVGGILPKLRDFFVTASTIKGGIHNIYQATVGWQMSIIKTNAEIERMTFLLRGMSTAVDTAGRIQEANQNLEYLFNMAQSAPFSINELTNSFVKMKSVGLDPMAGMLESLTDAVAAFGGNDQILHRASIAIQQMAGKGVISMEELRQQLGEAVPRAIELMARSLGVTYQELVDRISKGQVLAKEALQRTSDEMNNVFGGAGERMMQTWTGMVNVLQTRWVQFQVALGKEEYFNKAKQMLGEVIDAFDPTRVAYFASVVGEALYSFAQAVDSTSRFIADHKDGISTLIKTLGLLYGAYKALGILVTVRTWLTGLAGAIAAFTTAGTLATVQVAGLTGVLARFAVGLGVATTATRGLSVALAFLANPVLGIAAALGIAAVAWWDYESDATEAMESLNAKQKQLSEGEVRQLEKEIERLEALAEKKRGQAIFAQNHPAAVGYSEPERYLADAEKLEQQVTEMRLKMDIKREENMKIAGERATSIMKRQVDEESAVFRAAYDERMRVVDEQLKAEQITEQEHKKQRLAALDDLYDAMIQKHIEAQETITKVLEAQYAILSEAQKAALKSAIERSKAEIDKLKSELGRKQALVEKDFQYGDNSKDKGKLSKLESYITNLKAKTQDYKAEVAGASGELAKFIYLIESGAFGEEGAALRNNAAAWRDVTAAIRENDAAKKALDDSKTVTRAEDELASLKSRLGTDFNKAFASLTSGGADLNNSYVRTLTKQIDDLIAKLPAGSEAIKRFEEEGKAMVERASVTQSVIFIDGLREKTQALRESLLTEKEAVRARYQFEVQEAQRAAAAAIAAGETKAEATRQLNEYLVALENKMVRDTETPMQALNRQWQDTTTEMGNALSGWANEATDAITEFVKTGKLSFSSLADSIITDLIRIAVQQSITGPIGQAMGSFFGFANGGIMTGAGAMQLRKYASGGIANSPQLALFGEGSMPEAYVPLPDGRTIPVTLQGGLGGQTNVQVNVIEAPGTKANVRQSQDSDGNLSIDVIIEQLEGAMARGVSRGDGTLAGAIEKTYGLNRTAGAYR